MLLKEITKKNESKLPGTYAGMKFTKPTIKFINDLIDKFEIKNRTKESELHTTILFSRKHLPDYKSLGDLEEPLIGKSIKCEIWPTSDDEPMNALVLIFKCEELLARHTKLMSDHNAEYDYDEYKPHLTLSYDCGKDFDLKNINTFIKENPFDIEMNNEYQEDLDLDW
jgi:hypothetical protein